VRSAKTKREKRIVRDRFAGQSGPGTVHDSAPQTNCDGENLL
jgi:hypothetical protein